MKDPIFVCLALVFILFFAGCVQPPATTGGQQPGGAQQPGGPTVVNVTQGQQPAGGQAQPPPATPPAQVTVNQTAQQQQGGAQQAASSLSSQEISFTASDNWKIYGTLYPAKNSKPTIGVILVPQRGYDRSSFDPLVPVLHDALPDADIVALDTRGNGKSTNLGTYANFMAGDYRSMVNDVKGATSYLSFYRFVNNYYVVGSSVGATVAIRYAAQDSAVQKVVMLSPGMSYEGVDIAPALGQVRKEVFIIASDNDPQSSFDSQTAYSTSNAPVKKLFLYKTIGPAHGTDMFAASESSSEGKLTQMISDWLKNS